MADQKLTQLDAITSVSSDDIVYVVDDPGGSPISKKITVENLLGGWISADAMTYASADDPTYTMTCTGDKTSKYQAGQKIKLSQSTGGTKYFIVTKVEYSSSTTLTLYGGTDYNLEDEAISTPFYSIAKAPFGFPLDPTKWTVLTSDANDRSQASPAQNTWYNLSISINLPIGVWNVNYQSNIYASDTAASAWSIYTTLSTANNSESNSDWTSGLYFSEVKEAYSSVYRSGVISITAKATYYLNLRTTALNLDAIHFYGPNSPTIITAVCAYL